MFKKDKGEERNIKKFSLTTGMMRTKVKAPKAAAMTSSAASEQLAADSPLQTHTMRKREMPAAIATPMTPEKPEQVFRVIIVGDERGTK
jgi:hypothetical protein